MTEEKSKFEGLKATLEQLGDEINGKAHLGKRSDSELFHCKRLKRSTFLAAGLNV